LTHDLYCICICHSTSRSKSIQVVRDPMPVTIDEVDKDVSKAFERIRDLEDDLKEQREAAKRDRQDLGDVAKLAVYTARAQQQALGRYQIVCFLNGAFKTLVKTRFAEFLAKNKEARGIKEEAAAGAAAGASSASDTGMQVDVAPQIIKWKTVFLRLVGEWAMEQVAATGPKKEVQEAVMHPIEQLVNNSVIADRGIDFVRMEPREAPADHRAWVVVLSLKGTPEGATVNGFLTNELTVLYRNVGLDRRSKPADFSCRPDGGSKDRPLTASVANMAGLQPKLGRPQRAGPSVKRPSPAPDRRGGAQRPKRG